MSTHLLDQKDDFEYHLVVDVRTGPLSVRCGNGGSKDWKLNRIDLSALSQFDSLPGSAHVRLPVVASLLAVSTATVWRWSRAGSLPKPVRINGVTLWNVGALREHIRNASQPTECSTPVDTET
ncbi:MAG: helix-turn-helix transcriptional regulator [Burkholderiaceae bacterium]